MGNDSTVASAVQAERPTGIKRIIREVNPCINLSGDIDKIIDEVMNPDVSFNFLLTLRFEQLSALLSFIADHDLLALAEQTIQKGGSAVPAQLMVEFVKAVELLAKK